jgi:hypothetical protein
MTEKIKHIPGNVSQELIEAAAVALRDKLTSQPEDYEFTRYMSILNYETIAEHLLYYIASLPSSTRIGGRVLEDDWMLIEEAPRPLVREWSAKSQPFLCELQCGRVTTVYAAYRSESYEEPFEIKYYEFGPDGYAEEVGGATNFRPLPTPPSREK